MLYNFEKLEFQPISVMKALNDDGFFEVKARPYASIAVRLRGSGEFEVAGKHIHTKKGDILFMPSDTPYCVRYAGSEIIVVHLEGCNYREAEELSVQNASMIEEHFYRMFSLWNERHAVHKIKSLLYDMLDKIAEDKKSVVGGGEFARCVSYIHAHFGEASLNINDICEHGFISISTLQRKFQEHFGTSPKHYLHKLRMTKAIDLLIANELSVREIALACGFSDEKYFARAFKKHYGYPPSKMKNR